MARTFASASSQWLFLSSALLSVYPVTFSAWVNKTNNAASHGIISIGQTAGSTGIGLYTNSTGKLTADNGGGSGSVATSTVSITAATWTHVAGVWTSANLSVYISGGNKITTATSTAFGIPVRTYIGNVFEGGNFPMNGSIAFAGIWSSALSDTDILSLANGAHPMMIQAASLKACVNMTPGSNSPEPDLVSATGWTLNGTPTAAANPRIYMP